jgi:hypothetical protein
MQDAAERASEASDDGEAAWIWLGRDGRTAYDEARAEETTTVPGHHRLKATSKAASSGVDIAEALLDDADPTENPPFDVVARRFGPQEGDQIEIVHGKPDGRYPSLGRGEVVSADAEEEEMVVVVERRITSSGTYDALGVEREDGDVARTRFEEGGRAYATVYKSADGKKKGTYVNVCTPLEIFPDAVRYTDLYIDVVEVDGETRVVDEEELADAVDEGLVPEEAAERAYEVAESVEEGL